MMKVKVIVGSLIVILLIVVSVLTWRLELTTIQAIAMYGQYIVVLSVVIVFYQMKVNFQFNQRKATVDFMFGPVQTILLPLEFELKEKLNKDFLMFEKSESFLKTLESPTFNDVQRKELTRLVINILNFYERMSISIRKNTYDNDICYDDKGLLMIHFLNWTESYVLRLETSVEVRAYANARWIARSWKKRYNDHARKITASNDKSLDVKSIWNTEIT